MLRARLWLHGNDVLKVSVVGKPTGKSRASSYKPAAMHLKARSPRGQTGESISGSDQTQVGPSNPTRKYARSTEVTV